MSVWGMILRGREMRFRGLSRSRTAPLVLLLACATTAQVEELHPGIWLGRDLSSLPLPPSGYQVYLFGELHGVKETEGLLMQYLAKLHTGTGLRDVAIEEDAVYQSAAQDYVEGRSSELPEPLCLRAGVLQAIRTFNEGRTPNDRVRIHLVDIDSPATAIRQHLLAIKGRVAGADAVRIPEADDIARHGVAAVDALRKLAGSARMLSELRTIRHSILAYQQGFEVGTGSLKGSPYLDDREEAISSNMQDLLHDRDCRALLALYGSDHVTKARRKDGGPGRNREFSPLALRLEQSGVKVFSVVTFPLAGRVRWRGHVGELPYTAKDGLSDGTTLDRVLASVPGATLLYADPRRERIRLPSQDISAYVVYAFLAFANATEMDNHCVRP